MDGREARPTQRENPTGHRSVMFRARQGRQGLRHMGVIIVVGGKTSQRLGIRHEIAFRLCGRLLTHWLCFTFGGTGRTGDFRGCMQLAEAFPVSDEYITIDIAWPGQLVCYES